MRALFRRITPVLLLVAIGNATVRLVAWSHGHPGDTLSLTLALASGATAIIGYAAYLTRRQYGPERR